MTDTCRDCGDHIEWGESVCCMGCRVCNEYVTPAYQLRERYAQICPACTGPLSAIAGQFVCLWCGRTTPAPMWPHRNATETPALGDPFLDSKPLTLRVLAERYGRLERGTW